MSSIEEEEEEQAVFDDVDGEDSDPSDSDSDGAQNPNSVPDSSPIDQIEAPPPQIGNEGLNSVQINAIISPGDTIQQQQHVTPRVISVEERQRSFEESRKLFQRLWTDEDELIILDSFYEFVSGRGTVHASHQHDTGPFYEQIKGKLQMDFTKNQLIEKLRRLKKKFRNVVTRMAANGGNFTFRSPHEKATFEIARKIWSSHLKRGRDFDDDESLVILPMDTSVTEPENTPGDARRSRRRSRKRFASTEAVTAAAPLRIEFTATDGSTPAPPPAEVINHVNSNNSNFSSPPLPQLTQPTMLTSQSSNIVEETLRSCLSPLFKELLESVMNSNGPSRSTINGGLSLMPLGFDKGSVLNDEKWRKQQILELEVYAKRIELVQEQLKLKLEELRAEGS